MTAWQKLRRVHARLVEHANEEVDMLAMVVVILFWAMVFALNVITVAVAWGWDGWFGAAVLLVVLMFWIRLALLKLISDNPDLLDFEDDVDDDDDREVPRH